MTHAVPRSDDAKGPAIYEVKELGPAIAHAWELEIAGEREQARPILARAVASLPGAKRELGLGETRLGTLVADGKLVVVSPPAGIMLVCDVATGKVVGAMERAIDLAPIKKTPLFITIEARALVVRESPSGKALERFENNAGYVAADDGSVLVVSIADAIVVYDMQTRKITQRIALPPGSDATQLILGNGGKAVTAVTSGGSVGVGEKMQITYDMQSGQELVRGPSDFDVGLPAFSPDGQIIALVGDRRADGRHDDVLLVDRATKKTIATSSLCAYPNSLAFSADGKHLAVGRLRQACIFDVHGLGLVAKTPEMRPAGRGDDLQHTEVRFIDNVLFARTADGTVGFFAVPGATKLFIGRGQLVHIDGKPQVVTEDTSELVSIASAGRSISRRAMTKEEQGRPPYELDDDHPFAPEAVFTRIDPNVCRIHDWLLPRAACD